MNIISEDFSNVLICLTLPQHQDSAPNAVLVLNACFKLSELSLIVK